MDHHAIFITGATGYIGRRLVPLLAERGYPVRALIRPGSEGKLPPGCSQVPGNPLEKDTFVSAIAPCDTFIQLVGVAHPSPAKATEFRAIDLVSVRASVAAAAATGVRHFIYISVAQPAPMMRAYIEVRCEGEALLRASGLDATILRPWYVLGPGHWWPFLLLPVYWLCELLPSTRASARRLGLVSIGQVLRALVHATEHPPSGIRILQVPEIRARAETV